MDVKSCLNINAKIGGVLIYFYVVTNIAISYAKSLVSCWVCGASLEYIMLATLAMYIGSLAKSCTSLHRDFFIFSLVPVCVVPSFNMFTFPCYIPVTKQFAEKIPPFSKSQ